MADEGPHLADGLLDVIVYYRAAAGPGGADEIEAAYRASREMLRGTPGLLRQEFLRSVDRDDGFALVMEWQDLASYQAWEREIRRLGHPSPLRPYQDRSRTGGHYRIYAVTNP